MKLMQALHSDEGLLDTLEQCAHKYNLKDGVKVFRVGYGHFKFKSSEVHTALKTLKSGKYI